MLAQELTAEIAKSREIDSLTPRALEIFREMIDEFSVGIPAENSEECKQNAIDAITLHWKRLPPDRPDITVTFYGQILKSGYISKYKRKWLDTK